MKNSTYVLLHHKFGFLNILIMVFHYNMFPGYTVFYFMYLKTSFWIPCAYLTAKEVWGPKKARNGSKRSIRRIELEKTVLGGCRIATLIYLAHSKH